MKVAFIAEGDAETRDCWSGLAQKFIGALRSRGVDVLVLNAELKGWRRLLVGALSWRPSRTAWRQQFLFGGAGFAVRSRLARALLAPRLAGLDAVIQNGATFDPGDLPVPLIIYADANAAFSARGAPWSSVSQLDEGERRRVIAREARVYGRATRLWCTSDALAASFERDFGIARGRLRTIYAGANVVPAAGSAEPAPGPPLVLFVGKVHRRKGSDTLLAAFPEVRRQIPDAELHIVGARPEGAAGEGVVVHGFVASDRPEGRAKLQDLYRRATVFCLPSHYEPFGVVFVEAMLAGLPCIGTDRWAMPEIIAAGETGWLIPDGDDRALARCLIEALGDRAGSAAMGRKGRERALAMFTWDVVAGRALADLEQLKTSPVEQA